jgi:4'-phosphopantetheinyl transferase EntD
MSEIERPFSSIPGVCTLCSPIAETPAPLHESEQAHVSRAVPKRIREFAAGRALARVALRDLGVDAGPIQSSPERYPLWPEGVVGSISHSDRLVAVALSRSSVYRSIGIDVEREAAVPASIIRMIITPAERAAITSDDPVEAATVLFSCKESLYKAIYPCTHEFLDFHDVEIRVSGRQFAAECSAGKESAALIQRGRGFIEYRNGHVVSLFLLSA